MTVSEASWGCTASVSMVSRRRWERAQTFHMLQAGDKGGLVTDPASGSGVMRCLEPGRRANSGSPTASSLLCGSTTPSARPALAPAAIQGSAELARALLPHAVGRGFALGSRHLPSSWQRVHGRGAARFIGGASNVRAAEQGKGYSKGQAFPPAPLPSGGGDAVPATPKPQAKPTWNRPCSPSEARRRSPKSQPDPSQLPQRLTPAARSRRVNLLLPEGT